MERTSALVTVQVYSLSLGDYSQYVMVILKKYFGFLQVWSQYFHNVSLFQNQFWLEAWHQCSGTSSLHSKRWLNKIFQKYFKSLKTLACRLSFWYMIQLSASTQISSVLSWYLDFGISSSSNLVLQLNQNANEVSGTSSHLLFLFWEKKRAWYLQPRAVKTLFMHMSQVELSCTIRTLSLRN